MVNNCVVFFVCTLFHDQEQEGRGTFWFKINVRKLTVYLRLRCGEKPYFVGLSINSWIYL